MKAFLQPTLLKIVLAIFLFVIASWLWYLFVTATLSDTFPLGFPLAFLTAWGPCPPGESCSESDLFYLVLDILFWYLVSALGIWLIQRKNNRFWGL